MFEPYITVPREDVVVEADPDNPFGVTIRLRFKNTDAVDSTIEQLNHLKKFMKELGKRADERGGF